MPTTKNGHVHILQAQLENKQACIHKSAHTHTRAHSQVPPVPPSGPFPSSASTLHTCYAQWASLRSGPTHCLLLPQFLSAAAPPLLQPPSASGKMSFKSCHSMTLPTGSNQGGVSLESVRTIAPTCSLLQEAPRTVTHPHPS